MHLRAVRVLFPLVAIAAAAGDASSAGPSSTPTRRALKDLHLPAIISTTGTSEVVGRGLPSSGDDDDDETLSTGITKRLIRATAVDNAVIVTWANNHYRDFARFWISRLRALGKENFMERHPPLAERPNTPVRHLLNVCTDIDSFVKELSLLVDGRTVSALEPMKRRDPGGKV